MDNNSNQHMHVATPVAVIILNWNGAKLLREFLPSVVAHTNPAVGTVIVADNGSTDSSLQLLREEFPQVATIVFPENYGFAEGYNRAIAAVDAPYVVLLNSDVAVDTDWLSPLYHFMESHPDFGAVQPKLLAYKERQTFEYAGAAGGYLDRNGYPYCRGRIFGSVEHDDRQYDLPETEAYVCDWASGAALMVRRSLYIDAGGLDSRFFAHMEEIDLCWRIRLAGYKVGAVTASTVYHLGGGSLPASNPRKTYLNFRNNLLMLHKNLPDATRSRKLLVRRLLDTIAWAKFVATLDWGNASAVWRAHRDFAKMRTDYTEHPSVDLLTNPVNILTAYYLKGIRKFSQL